MPQYNGSVRSSDKQNWSASRISTYRQCPLKYYYTYVKKWRCSKAPDTTAADKGTCFHETVEHFKTGMEHAKLYEIMESKIAYRGHGIADGQRASEAAATRESCKAY